MRYGWRGHGLMLAALALLLASCAQPVTAPPQPVAPVVVAPITDIPLVEVRRGDLVETTVVPAELTPVREATLFFRQNGRLLNLTVNSNDKVTAGQVLAEMETGNLATEIALAELAAARAQARLEQAKSQLADRYTIELAELDYETARISLEKLRDQLEATRLVAPFDGVITETNGRPGEMVSAFAPVVTVADTSSLQITAQVSSPADTSLLALGQAGTLVLDRFQNVKIPVHVVQLPTMAATLPSGSPVPADVSRRFMLANDQPLPPAAEMGLQGRVTLVLREKKDVLLVKSTAVRSLGERRYVQVAQNGVRRDVDVQVGIVNPTDTEIIKGLKEGDMVVDGPPIPPTPVPGGPAAKTKP